MYRRWLSPFGIMALLLLGVWGGLGVAPAGAWVEAVPAQAPTAAAPLTGTLKISPLSTFESGLGSGSAEIVKHDPTTQRLYVVNAVSVTVDVLDISNPLSPTRLFAIDATPYGGAANSVDVRNGSVAIAVEAVDRQQPGQVLFFSADGTFQRAVPVGAVPDMLTFTPDGQAVVVANEGEPANDYSVDPEGSVTIIPTGKGTPITVGFSDFNEGGPRHGELDPAIRLFGPGATVAQDLEPEFLTISADSTTAWVTLQENNALAVIDLVAGSVTSLVPLGTKDHSLVGLGLDASDRDGPAISIQNWPVQGLYLPDAIASFQVGGTPYLITANEGDARAYSAFNEETRVGSVTLDPTAFPNAATLQEDANLGRLRLTNTMGDTDTDGDFDILYSFGARSFTIWNATGSLVFDSGDELEQRTAALVPTRFNSNGLAATFDTRSDDKGPEPEAVAVATIAGRPYAFVGLERTGGVFVYDVSVPAAPTFVTYADNWDDAGNPEVGTTGDIGTEGLIVIAASDSPTGNPLLVTSNEVSGNTTLYEIIPAAPTAVTLAHLAAPASARPGGWLLAGVAGALGLLALRRRR